MPDIAPFIKPMKSGTTPISTPPRDIKSILASEIPIISQKDFVAELKKQMDPEDLKAISGASDAEIMAHAFKIRPELKSRVQNPTIHDAANARAQQSTLMDKSRNEAFTRQLLNVLPAIGGLTGAAAATPETMGLGSVGGLGLGTAFGQGVKNKIAEYLGLENPTSPFENALSMGKEGLIAAATPGMFEAIESPIETGKGALVDVGQHMETILPERVKAWSMPQGLRNIAKRGFFDPVEVAPRGTASFYDKPSTIEIPDFLKPTGTESKIDLNNLKPPQRGNPFAPFPKEPELPLSRPPSASGTGMSVDPTVPRAPGYNAPAPKLPLSRPPMSSGTGMSVDPNSIFTRPTPKVGTIVPEGAAPPDLTGQGFTEGQFEVVPPKELGPATTRFEPEANPDLNMKAIESPEAITESKVQNTIDAMNAQDAAIAPGPGKSEEDVLHHYMQTTESMSPNLSKQLIDAGYTANVDPVTGHIIWRIAK